jgi:predicted nucleic acid-binding protein
MTVLVDTSVLLAFAFTRDKNHQQAAELIQSMKDEARLVPTPVLSELFYMTMIRISYERAVQVFIHTRTAFQIEQLTEADMDRMLSIMAKYKDAQFDFADVAIMAIAERHGIDQICTFDHRDFSVYRPEHCEYFTLLP